jgi:hypothetical protein
MFRILVIQRIFTLNYVGNYVNYFGKSNSLFFGLLDF